MLCEVISIGDELASGQSLDTNSQWLSARLGEIGVRVVYHTTVADDLDANVEVFRQAAQRSDIVIATGGLGPTADDLTREALARVAGKELVLDETSLRHIMAIFAKRRREMPERNRVQALFPAGSRVISNPEGTAPGIDLDVPRISGGTSRIFALPGVPAEMREMWRQTVAPAIRAMQPGRVIVHRRIKCFGVGESQLEAMLPDLIRRGRVPQVGITVSGATITLRITAEGPTEEECLALIQPTIVLVHQCLGTLAFGEEDDELEHAVVRLLAKHGRTLATVEHGGLLAKWLASVPGGSGQYAGGMVVTAPAAAARLLDVPAESLQPSGQATRQTTEEMATACRRRFQSDYALAMSPLPLQTASAAEPVHVALASDQGVAVESWPLFGHPSIHEQLSAKRALNMLRLKLLA